MRIRPSRLTLLAVGLGTLAVASIFPAQALNDPEYDKQWGLQVIGAKAAWDAGLLGEGVDIAIVDTGVHLDHQDLRANIGKGIDLVNNDDRAQDDNQHGTHVAGIAAASIDNGGTVGVAPRARILPVKVLGADGSGRGSDVSAGIRWAADNGAEVINLSLGEADQSLFGPSTQEAVKYAWSKGSICVFAAGNDFVLPSGFEDEPALVVSSTSRMDRESDFSNGVGNAMWGIAAPGGAESSVLDPATEDIFSTVWVSDARRDTYRYLAGTSMAAPHVAGAAAVLRGAGLSPQQTVDRLLATAKDLGPPGRDSTFGAGRLDLAKASAGLRPNAPAPAPAPTATPGSAPAPSAAPAPSGQGSSAPPPTTAAPRSGGSRTAPTPTTPRPAAPAPTSAAPSPDTAPAVAPETTLAPVEVTDEPVAIDPVDPSGDNELVALDDRSDEPSGFDDWPWAALAGVLLATTTGAAVWRRRADRV